jgi:hypothetical protein
LEIIRDNCDRAFWDDISTQASRSPLEQSWVYGEAVRDHYGMSVERAVIRSGNETLGIFQLFKKRFLGVVDVSRLVRGPIWIDRLAGSAPRIEAMSAIAKSFSLPRRDLLFWTPELSDTPEHRDLMRKVGKRRMVTGLSTAWLDITKTSEELLRGFSGNWRNMLRAGKRANLKTRIRDDGKGVSTHLAAYDAFRQQKRFVGPPSELIRSMSENGSKGDIVTLTAGTTQQIVAGILFVRHGNSATYYTSWNSDEGRNSRAHNVLLWRAIQELRERGIKWLDLGGLNTESAAGVARFKIGLGGEIVTLSGTYL